MLFKSRVYGDHTHLSIQLHERDVACLLPAQLSVSPGLSVYLGRAFLLAHASQGLIALARIAHVPAKFGQHAKFSYPLETIANYENAHFIVGAHASTIDVLFDEHVLATLTAGKKFESQNGLYTIRIQPPKYTSDTSEWRVAA
jgi:hypothetical protein